jgi:hypothetical protein
MTVRNSIPVSAHVAPSEFATTPRKLAVFEVRRAGAEALAPWSGDVNCFSLAVNPIAVGAWRHEPMQVTNYETITARHVALCRPLFEAGTNNQGPRLKDAALSFIAAADFALFMESRNQVALLTDLERLLRQHECERIEFVTDLADGGRYYPTVRAFSAAHKIPCRRVQLEFPSIGLARSVLRAVDWTARALHPHGPAYLDYCRETVRRRISAFKSRVPRRAPSAVHTANRAECAVRAAMLVYHPKSWRHVLPIRQQLVNNGHEVVLISPRLETDSVLQQAGIPFLSLPRALPRGRLLRDIERYFDALPLAIDALGMQIGNSTMGAIRDVFQRLALSMAPIYAGLAAPLEKLLKRERINVVLGTDSGSVAGRLLFRSAERVGIPSVFVQHGALVQGAQVAPYFTAAQLLVWGASSRDNLTASGVSHPERINCMGSPYQEEVLMAANESNAQSPPTVLVTFGVPGGAVAEGPFLRAATEVIDAAQGLPNVQFVIKPHPGDKTDVWAGVKAGRDLPNVAVHPDADTYALMRSCRVLVTMVSTTGAEAICLGKPVISINLDGLNRGLDYITAGAAYTIDQSGSLAVLLRSLIESAPGADRLAVARRNFVESFLHREERPAADRIVDYLQCLALGNSFANPRCVKS